VPRLLIVRHTQSPHCLEMFEAVVARTAVVGPVDAQTRSKARELGGTLAATLMG
jgi:hypothetical protein